MKAVGLDVDWRMGAGRTSVGNDSWVNRRHRRALGGTANAIDDVGLERRRFLVLLPLLRDYRTSKSTIVPGYKLPPSWTTTTLPRPLASSSQRLRTGSHKQADVSKSVLPSMRLLTRPENRMDCKANIDSIRALDEQIREYEETLIKLKRTRNSLLNVSKLPPEVLGDIFHWNVIRKGDFGGLDEGSHNFLPVCHHWFEVASRTPELWSFWGNTTKDWARWYRRFGTTPLDLVLSAGHFADDFDGGGLNRDLRNALKDRAAQDTIRLVHLKADESTLIDDIIDDLTTTGGELRPNSMESLVLWNLDYTDVVDVSGFFAHYRFPRLRRLDLTNCSISSWDHLSLRTSILTTLKLDFANRSRTPLSTPTLAPTPTTSQLLSMLASNPTLQRVALSRCAIPDDGGGESSSRVQLRHLKELRLDGNLQHVLKLLNQLDHPRNLYTLALTLYGCDVVDIPRTIGPYLRDYLQRRDKPQGGLNLFVSSGGNHIAFHAGDARLIDFSALSQAEINVFAEIVVVLNAEQHRDILERAALDLTTYAPREDVVHFRMYNEFATGVDTYTQFPNLRALSFANISLPLAIPNPNLIGEGKILPSLEHISLENMDVYDSTDWSLLVTFLAQRVSSGNRLDTLVIVRSPHICPGVMESMRGKVRELRIEDQRPRHPHDECCT